MTYGTELFLTIRCKICGDYIAEILSKQFTKHSTIQQNIPFYRNNKNEVAIISPGNFPLDKRLIQLFHSTDLVCYYTSKYNHKFQFTELMDAHFVTLLILELILGTKALSSELMSLCTITIINSALTLLTI